MIFSTVEIIILESGTAGNGEWYMPIGISNREVKWKLVRTDRMVDHGYVLPTRGLVLDSDGSQDQLARAQGCSTLARTAESIGFSSVWVGDSVLAKPRLDPLSTLAAVAAETDGIRSAVGRR